MCTLLKDTFPSYIPCTLWNSWCGRSLEVGAAFKYNFFCQFSFSLAVWIFFDARRATAWITHRTFLHKNRIFAIRPRFTSLDFSQSQNKMSAEYLPVSLFNVYIYICLSVGSVFFERNSRRDEEAFTIWNVCQCFIIDWWRTNFSPDC